ncbi:decapping endonuclease targeting mRNA [Yamadazyma tenuis]|uniref:Decapping nuclease n=1 Tax=Candida tenuis (strain ATCC 10573 / BCRC 21748 / CBS 615 / JCM 9827 / NBRC 10315 / NRRL Y-1498 / VKM Y-70) TaxID=590646 RepID=G3BEK3_CANTC|nr:RAI1-domain-containing protein [Yamadazyma tenuis ATCC 10573]EGV60564.1 RAI1-domain-containing protein [Yamadazyma tenuis ATCC 10573]WEJ94192.1 decapping endonuclease targeting mRNA [Yamadazyma tenuis]
MIRTLPLTARAPVASLKKPKELTTYRRDLNGNYIHDDEGHSYFYFPDSYVERGFDMAAGFSKFNKIPEAKNLGDFHAILAALVKHEQSVGARVECDVIAFRGIMTKLMTLPIARDDFSLKVLTYGGHIMIKNNDEFELTRRTANTPTDLGQRLEYSGYKFEKLVMLPRPWSECSRATIESRPTQEVNNYEQLISVVRTGIGKTRMVLAGEVDGIFDYKPVSDSNLPHYIELKTNNLITNEHQMKSFEKKLYKTWAQCFLMGIKNIGVGFRDESLHLRNVEIYEADEIPAMLKDKINCVSSLKFFGALMEWLNELDKTVTKSYTMSFESGKVMLMESPLSFESEFLTEEFKRWRQSLA